MERVRQKNILEIREKGLVKMTVIQMQTPVKNENNSFPSRRDPNEKVSKDFNTQCNSDHLDILQSYEIIIFLFLHI